MFQRSELQQLGSRVLAGGLVVAAVTLSVVVADQVLTGGTLSIRATCVLFLWTSGAAILIGMILRIIGSRPRLAGPMPRPRPRRRSRRSPSWH
ncbi:MAG: hypothetical protein M3P87_04195 [Actinomycetota bacterium]|nr:hypothetical protein [Actinomycetota bacterium]